MADCYIEKILLESLQVTNGTSFAEFKSEVIKQNAVPISVLGLIFLSGLPANAVMLHVFRTAFKKSAYKLFSIWLACLGHCYHSSAHYILAFSVGNEQSL